MEDAKIVPLNGVKTHPLSDHAKKILAQLAENPLPRQEINPGVANRLLRENLAARFHAASPYKSHKGSLIEFLNITAAGRAALLPDNHGAL